MTGGREGGGEDVSVSCTVMADLSATQAVHSAAVLSCKIFFKIPVTSLLRTSSSKELLYVLFFTSFFLCLILKICRKNVHH